MIECVFCYSPSKEDYIFTECDHLVCTDCASAKWDKKYSLRCCNKLTYLSEETSNALTEMENERSVCRPLAQKENIERSYDNSRSNLSIVKTPQGELEQSYLHKIRLEESLLVKSIEPKQQEVVDSDDIQREKNLVQMERVLSE
jgi:hypothetical protein